jgi:hypothetical protein
MSKKLRGKRSLKEEAENKVKAGWQKVQRKEAFGACAAVM